MTLDMKLIPIKDLKPAEYNPRKKVVPGSPEYQKLRKSIEEFGMVQPIVVNKDMTVIAGHQRLVVLKHMGKNAVDCIILDVDKVKEKALNIALNNIEGSFDDKMLAELMKDIMDSGEIDATVTGFTEKEIEEQLKSIATTTKNMTPFDFDPEGDTNGIPMPRVKEDKEGSYSGTTSTVANMVVFGKNRAPLKTEEYKHLEECFKRHVKEHRNAFGFVSRMLRGEFNPEIKS
jgi:hypothetical protein